MSSNKGKDGELRAAIVVANIGRREDGVDFTRPTTTNTADQGADLFMTHPKGYLDTFAKVSQSQLPSPKTEASTNGHTAFQKSRIDVKTTEKKLQKDTVEKFIADCHNHPTCTGHILMGGLDLTGPGHRYFGNAQERFAASGKTLLYVSNDGIQKLEAHYQPQIEHKKDDE